MTATVCLSRLERRKGPHHGSGHDAEDTQDTIAISFLVKCGAAVLAGYTVLQGAVVQNGNLAGGSREGLCVACTGGQASIERTECCVVSVLPIIVAAKRVGVFSVDVEEAHDDGMTRTLRRVMRVIERRIDKHGNRLLVPEIMVEGWWTSFGEVACEDDRIIELYCEHATSEQFHSEFNTDLNIERLPSGKFATNDLVMACAVLAYNILRWIGLVGLLRDDAPIRHKAERRRLRTVIQELMYVAARVVASGRRLALKFSTTCPAFPSFAAVYARLVPG